MSTDKQKTITDLIREKVKTHKTRYKLSLAIDKKSILEAQNEVLAAQDGKAFEQEQ